MFWDPRVSMHMELIKSKLHVEASPHQAPGPNEGAQPTAAQTGLLPCPPPQGLSDARGMPSERRGWDAGPREHPVPLPRHRMGPPKPFKGQLLPGSTALRQEAVMGAKRPLKINVEQKNFHKIKIAVSFPLITYYKAC